MSAKSDKKMFLIKKKKNTKLPWLIYNEIRIFLDCL